MGMAVYVASVFSISQCLDEEFQCIPFSIFHEMCMHALNVQ